MSLTGELWALLDGATDRFMGIPKEDRQTPDALKAAGEARGLSNAIHVMCKPHYEDGTAVAKLAIKRMKARQAGEDMPPTPGDMSDAEAQQATVAKHEETKAKAKVAPKEQQARPAEEAAPSGTPAAVDDDAVRVEVAGLREQQVKQITNGLRCDFEPSKLAELFKVSQDAILYIKKDAGIE